MNRTITTEETKKLFECGIVIYGQSVFIPQKIKQHFFETFPEFVV